MVVAGDIHRAFLQVRIRETERDALQFHWIADKSAKQVETLRFTRVVFGLAPSPFLLNGVIQQHLENLLSTYPDAVNEICKSLYVADLLSGGPTIKKAKKLKGEATEIFADAKFKLHKWHSNRKELETACEDYEPSFAKEQLENTQARGPCKLLGVGWDKVEDTLHVCFPATPAEQMKRGILTNLAKVYDPFGIVSPVMLDRKVLYRESCIEKFWIPRLQKLTKRVVRICSGCKHFQAVAFANPPPAPLTRERTEGTMPFNVIGVDFAGPVKHRDKRKEEQKAYVVLYSCCLTCGVFLELLPSLETTELIKSLKRLIARRGRPSKIYSDNGQTFVAAAKWLKKVQKDERFHSFLGDQSIIWQFNLSRAPWWGGQFKRLIGLMKSAFYKTVGQGQLSWEELGEVILDVE